MTLAERRAKFANKESGGTTAKELGITEEALKELQDETAWQYEPDASDESVAGDEPVAGVEPVAAVEPVASVEPDAGVEPVAGIEPVTGVEPVASVEQSSEVGNTIPDMVKPASRARQH